jgi:protein ImuA
MAMAAAARAELSRLRQDIARIEGRLAEAKRLTLDSGVTPDVASAEGLRPRELKGRLPLGIPALDTLLADGLPLATLHEIRTPESRDAAAAAGFALALSARLAAIGGAFPLLWIGEADAQRETGALYAPGLAVLGLDPANIVTVAARNESDALWAFEAALNCRGLGVAICELRQASLDLSATRRCILRARAAGVTGFLLRMGGRAEASAAELRFRVSPAGAGTIGGFAAGIGRMTWRLALEKNQGGRTGAVTVEWNAHERCFAERGRTRRADPQPLPAAPPDRPSYPGRAEGGAAGHADAGWQRAS